MLRIVPISNSKFYSCYIDGIKINGKRQRRFFASEKEAKIELRKLEIQLRREGEQGLSIPEETRILATKATKLLEPFDRNVLDAAKFYVAHLESLSTDVRVSALVDEYQETKRKAQFSAAYLDDIRQRLGAFNELFGTRTVKSLKSSEIEEWLHGLGLAPQTVVNYRAILHAFFAFVVKRGYVENNPVSAIDKIRLADGTPEIFTPDELAKILSVAPSNLLPTLAIGAFAGLRASELLRLEWSEVDLARGYIHVAARKSKSARRRLVKILPNLASWLAPYNASQGKIYLNQKRAYHHAIEEVSRTTGITWKKNGLRHSFASYHLAKYANAAELMLQLGHTTTRLIFEAYREVVTPEAAERYWAIMPPATPANVVRMEATQ
ncbi:MAG: tyrosine-type recombinase/integrase [Chthoniobacterales bacterium]